MIIEVSRNLSSFPYSPLIEKEDLIKLSYLSFVFISGLGLTASIKQRAFLRVIKQKFSEVDDNNNKNYKSVNQSCSTTGASTSRRGN